MTRAADWWPRLEEAFHGALALPLPERSAYLEQVCGPDTDLRAELEAMLTADAPDRALGIERLVHDSDDLPVDSELEPDPFIGMRLGPWRVLDVIGHGGMGTVYLAERADGQYEQQVALKLIRGSARRTQAAARFKAETFILGRLSHPNIARLLDAGLTPEGSAYLVMEYVDGSPVTAHCDTQRLTIDERLRLFRIVCDATQHAHQALVVHRDLKPSNIFVSCAGEVKLLDFGIAKLLEPDHPLSDQTTDGMRALTPAYAAPEQLRGDVVTTAADVYVLGAVLYELLTGQRPASGALEIAIAPSLIVRRQLATASDSARHALSEIAIARRTSPARLARRLAGDIDRVVLKALQLEPARRYGSAGELGQDLQRLIDGRPVVAQADTVVYRTRRFIGRHRIGVAMAAVLAMILVAFAVVATMQGRAVAVERDRARVEASRAARVSLLVTDLFKLAEPAVGRGDTITARELLDRGAHRVALELTGDPDTQAALFNAIGRVYANLGLHDAAIGVLTQALGLEPGAHAEAASMRAETQHLLGASYAAKSDYAAADRHFRDALALRRRLHAGGSELAATLDALGGTLGITGRFDEARALIEEAVEIRRRQPDAPAIDLMSGLRELGLLLHRSGDVARAESLFREAVEVGRAIPGPSPAKVTSLVGLAEVVADFDRDATKAGTVLREALAMARSIYPGDHHEIANCLCLLASNQLQLGQLKDAEAAAREGAAMFQRLYGERHDETLIANRILAGVFRADNRLDEAQVLLRNALEHSRALFGETNPTTLAASRSLASVLEEQRRFGEALELRQRELARTVKALGEDDVFVAIGLTGLGQHGLLSGQSELAERYFTRALEVRKRIHPPDHWRIDEARGLLGVSRLRAGRLADAEADLVAAYEGLQAHRGPAAPETERARTRLVELYERWSRKEQAQRYRDLAR